MIYINLTLAISLLQLSFNICLQEFAMDGLVNIVGGCCGTTPGHIRSLSCFSQVNKKCLYYISYNTLTKKKSLSSSLLIQSHIWSSQTLPAKSSCCWYLSRLFAALRYWNLLLPPVKSLIWYPNPTIWTTLQLVKCSCFNYYNPKIP